MKRAREKAEREGKRGVWREGGELHYRLIKKLGWTGNRHATHMLPARLAQGCRKGRCGVSEDAQGATDAAGPSQEPCSLKLQFRATITPTSFMTRRENVKQRKSTV